MGKIKFNTLMNNDVLLGLIGKTCKCQEHQHPLHHFNIKDDEDVNVELKINNIEVPGAAGFLQAYFRQSEKLVADRVRRFCNGNLKELQDLVYEVESKIYDDNENIETNSIRNKVREIEMLLNKKLNELLGDSNQIEKSPPQ